MSFVLLSAAVFLGGVLTIVSPCILPVLPFVFGAAGRPFARWTAPMMAGLITSFVAVAVVGTIGSAWAAESLNAGRWLAIVLLAFTGLSLLSTRAATLIAQPIVRLGEKLERIVGVGASRREQAGRSHRAPLRAFTLGVATGLLWAPCAGPVLGLALALAASGAAPARATVLFAVFGTGAASALAAALLASGRALGVLRRFSSADAWVRRALGGVALASVGLIAFGRDATLLSRAGLVQTAAAEEVVLARLAPNAKREVTSALTARSASRLVPIPDLGPLPDFAGGTAWLNADGLGVPSAGGTLTAESLRGKVVVVNVWTFECYNCLNALPHVKALAAKYRDRDVVVIGVHTPELARERVPANVATAVQRLGVTYPVVLDPDYRIWQAFNNEYWPSLYIADTKGRIRFRHFGEGAYDEEDRVVAQLLGEANH